MSSDYYIIRDEYMDYSEQINDLIDEIYQNYPCLNEYIWRYSYLLSQQNKDFEESEKKRYGSCFCKNYSTGIFFPVIQNYSFIVFLFLTIENHIRRLAEYHFKATVKTNLKFGEYLKQSGYKGGNFEKFLKYFCDQMRIDHSKLVFWPQTEKLQKIRDCIVHVSGFLPESRDCIAIKQFIQARDYFSGEEKKEPKKEYRYDDFYEKGELYFDDEEERLIVGGYYCKLQTHYSKHFLLDLLHKSDLVIYAAP